MNSTCEIKDSYDAAVVGAGPAGSSLAIRLAMAGHKVVLVEHKKFPRQKLCGEFISPECLGHFHELGVLSSITAAGGSQLRETIFYARNGKGVSVKSEWFGDGNSFALGLSRAEMDTRLMFRARELGVEVLEETSVIGVLNHGGNVSGIKIRDKSGNTIEINASITVDATGRARAVTRLLDSPRAQKSPAKHIAFKTHITGVDLTSGACEIYAYRGGYGGCNRVENGLYNVCFIVAAAEAKRFASDPEKIMRGVLFTNRRAAKALNDARVEKPWLAVPIQSFGRSELTPASGLLTVGDAAAFIDPFTGSGMLLALEGSKVATEAILDCWDDPAKIAINYRIKYAKAFDQRLKVCEILRRAAFVPFLAESTIYFMGMSSSLRRRLAQLTRVSVEPGV